DHLERSPGGAGGTGGTGEAAPLAALDLVAAGEHLGAGEAGARAEADPAAVEGHALPAGAQEGLAAGGVADAAGHRLAVDDQGHRDRPLGKPLHELPGAIEGVDHPGPAAAETGAVVLGLLGEPSLAGARQRPPQERV